MTLYDLFHDFSRKLTNDPNLLFDLFTKDGKEDRDIGDIWWYVIGFRREFSIDEFEKNTYKILYTTEFFQYPKQAENFLKSRKYTDIYTRSFVFDK